MPGAEQPLFSMALQGYDHYPLASKKGMVTADRDFVLPINAKLPAES